MTSFNVHEQKIDHTKRPGVLARLLASVFKLTVFVLSPFVGVWSRLVARSRPEKLKREIQANMGWTLSNLHPRMIQLPSGSQTQHTFMVLESAPYRIWIAMESYHGGQDYWARIGPSCEKDLFYPIDLLAQALVMVKSTSEHPHPRVLIRSLSDLDSAIRDLDPLLRKYLSSEKWEEVHVQVDAYIKSEWERRSKRPRSDSRSSVPRLQTF